MYTEQSYSSFLQRVLIVRLCCYTAIHSLRTTGHFAWGQDIRAVLFHYKIWCRFCGPGRLLLGITRGRQQGPLPVAPLPERLLSKRTDRGKMAYYLHGMWNNRRAYRHALERKNIRRFQIEAGNHRRLTHSLTPHRADTGLFLAAWGTGVLCAIAAPAAIILAFSLIAVLVAEKRHWKTAVSITFNCLTELHNSFQHIPAFQYICSCTHTCLNPSSRTPLSQASAMATNAPNGSHPTITRALSEDSALHHPHQDLTPPSQLPAPRPVPMAPMIPAFVMSLSAPRSSEARFFSGDNVTAFLHDYKRMILCYGYPDDCAALLMEDYCDEGVVLQVRSLYDEHTTLPSLVEAMKERFGHFDKEQFLGTIEALTQYVEEVLRFGKMDIIQYSRTFDKIVRRATEAGYPIDGAQIVRQYLRGLPRDIQRRVVSRVGISPLHPRGEHYAAAVECSEQIARESQSLDLLNSPLAGVSMLNQLQLPERTKSPDAPVALLQPSSRPRSAPTPPERTVSSSAPRARITDKPTLLVEVPVDQLVEQFKALRLNATNLSPIVHASGVRGLAYATVMARCAVSETANDAAPAPQYNIHTAPSMPQQSTHPGFTTMECYTCGKRGHRSRSCPEITKLIDEGMLHLGPTAHLCWGTLENPGPELMGLPPTRRLEAIQRMIRDHKRVNGPTGGVANIRVHFQDTGDDLSSDEKYDRYIIAGSARAVTRSQTKAGLQNTDEPHPVADPKARVQKKQRPPRVKTT